MKRKNKSRIILWSLIIVAIMLLVSFLLVFAFKDAFLTGGSGIFKTLADEILTLFFNGESTEWSNILCNFWSTNLIILIIILVFVFALMLIKAVYEILMRAFGRWRL